MADQEQAGRAVDGDDRVLGSVSARRGVLASAVAGAALVACGGDTAPAAPAAPVAKAEPTKAAAAAAPTTAPAPTAAPAAPAAKAVPTVISAQTELQVWLNDHGPEVQKWWDDELMPAFKKEQPNIKVVVKWENWTGVADRLNAVMVAGSLPDVFTGGAEWVGSMAGKKMALDISPYVKVWGESSDFTESAMNATMSGGKNYGVPVTSDARVLVYRKDLFRAAGLDPEKQPTSWEELLDWGRRLTKTEGDKIAVSGYGMTTNWSSWCAYMYQAGGDYVTADGAKATVDTAAAQDWGQFIWDVFNKFKLADPKGLAGAFETGQQAMTEAGPGVGLAMQKNGGLENLGIASPIKRKSQQTAVFTNWLCVGAQTKVPDASWKFVEFYTRAANMQKFHELRGSPPPRKALQSQAYVKDNPVFRRFGEIAGQYGRAFTPSCAWTDFRQQLIDFNKELAEKQRTAKDVLPELGRDMAKALGDCSK